MNIIAFLARYFVFVLIGSIIYFPIGLIITLALLPILYKLDKAWDDIKWPIYRRFGYKSHTEDKNVSPKEFVEEAKKEMEKN